jgi:hypothetical protein
VSRRWPFSSHSPRDRRAAITRPWSQPAWQRTSTLPSPASLIDRLGTRSSWAGQRATQPPPAFRPPRALAMVSAVIAVPRRHPRWQAWRCHSPERVSRRGTIRRGWRCDGCVSAARQGRLKPHNVRLLDAAKHEAGELGTEPNEISRRRGERGIIDHPTGRRTRFAALWAEHQARRPRALGALAPRFKEGAARTPIAPHHGSARGYPRLATL